MADEAERPLEHLAAVEQAIVPEPAAPSAPERLRAFEDEHLGKDCVRIRGKVERGSGSPYQLMSPELKAQYAALEKLIEAEQKLADARAAVLQAEADHAAALAALEAKPDAAPVE